MSVGARTKSRVIYPRSAHMCWESALVSDFSQYSKGSTAACTVMALECALRLQTESTVDGILIQNVLDTGALYTSELHTGIDEILPAVGRYKNTLATVSAPGQSPFSQYSVRDIPKMIRDTMSLVKNSGKSISVLLTKPPESVFFHLSHNDGSVFLPLLFDSHPRPEQGLEGAHFLLFGDADSIINYLSKVLFPYISMEDAGFLGEQLNTVEASFLSLKPNATVAPLDASALQIEFQRIGKKKEIIRQKDDDAKMGREIEVREHQNVAKDFASRGPFKNSRNQRQSSRTQNVPQEHNNTIASFWRQLERKDEEIKRLHNLLNAVVAQKKELEAENHQLKLTNTNQSRQMWASKKVCRIFREGNCTRGARCWFSHDLSQVESRKDDTKQKAFGHPRGSGSPGKARGASRGGAPRRGKGRRGGRGRGGPRSGARGGPRGGPRGGASRRGDLRKQSSLHIDGASLGKALRGGSLKAPPSEGPPSGEKGEGGDSRSEGSPGRARRNNVSGDVDDATARLIEEMLTKDAVEEAIFQQDRQMALQLSQQRADAYDADHALAQAQQQQLNQERASYESDQKFATEQQHKFDQENQRLLVDAHFAQDMVEQPLKCPICMDDCPREDVFIINACGHELCRECARDCIISAMRRNQYPPKCPVCAAESAGQNSGDEPKSCEISQHEVLMVLSLEEQLQYFNQSIDVVVEGSSDMKHCPMPDRPGVHLMGVGNESHCQVCDKTVCLSCQVEWHDGSTCEVYQENRKENNEGEQRFHDLVAREKWMKCPHCTAMVDKIIDCNHMKCRCGHHFCYLCGVQIPADNHYGHFNDPRGACYGKLFDESELRDTQ